MDTRRQVDKRNHALTLLVELNTLRKHHRWSLDCNIRVGRKTFEAHSVVLAGNSTFFRSKLHELSGEKKNIKLEDVEEGGVKLCIDFMYTAEVELTAKNVFEVLNAADKFKMDALIDLCLRSIGQHVSPQNCFSVRKWFRKYAYLEEDKKVKCYTEEHVNRVIKSSEYLNLPQQEVAAWLEEVRMKEYTFLWDAIISWTNFRKEERNEALLDLLKPFFGRFPHAYFIVSLAETKSATYFQKKMILSQYFQQKIRSGESRLLIDSISQSKTPLYRQSKEALEAILGATKDITETFSVSLSKVGFLFLLDSFKSSAISEETKWDLIVKWTNHISSRKKCFPELFDKIIPERFDPSFLINVVNQDPLVLSCRGTSKVERNSTDCFSSPVTKKARVDAPQSSSQPPKEKNFESRSEASFSPQERCETTPSSKNVMEKYFIAIHEWKSVAIHGIDLETKRFCKLTREQNPSADDFRAVVALEDQLYWMRGSLLKRRKKNKRWEKLEGLQRIPTAEAKLAASVSHIYLVDKKLVARYDPGNDTWEIRDVDEITGRDFCICASDKHLFILGGNETPRRALLYNPTSRMAVEIKQMTRPRVHSAAVSFHGRVYVTGGSKNYEEAKSLECYDPRLDGWTELGVMKMARWNLCACIYQKKIYLVGGEGKSSKTNTSVEVFDLDNDSSKGWQKIDIDHRIGVPFTACVAKTFSI